MCSTGRNGRAGTACTARQILTAVKRPRTSPRQWLARWGACRQSAELSLGQQIFDNTLPAEMLSNSNHASVVAEAMRCALVKGASDDIFVDCQTSTASDYVLWAVGARAESVSLAFGSRLLLLWLSNNLEALEHSTASLLSGMCFRAGLLEASSAPGQASYMSTCSERVFFCQKDVLGAPHWLDRCTAIAVLAFGWTHERCQAMRGSHGCLEHC